MTVKEILDENERRKAEMFAPYDPVEGDANDAGRVKFVFGGIDTCRIPIAMLEDAELKELLKDKFSTDLQKRFDEIRIRYDFPYWAATRAYIKQKGGGEDILFVLNRPQRKLVTELERQRLAGKPIRLILLKARQWGGSTCVQLYMSWLQLVHQTGLNSLIIAHQSVASDEIKDMFDRMLRNYPGEIVDENGESAVKLVECVGKSGMTIRVVPRNCKVKVGTAESPDSCRGGDYNLVHCSEVGLWKATKHKTPEQILRAACSGVLFRPMTMILFESTANGTGNFFHREYEAAKRGESQFSALFIPWYDIEQYSLSFLEGEKESFATRLLEGRHSRQSGSDRKQPGAYLWWLWESGATLEAIHWYEAERAKYSDHGLMAAEYPSDDVEAFVHSGANVFDKYKVEALRKDCGIPIAKGEIDGESPSDKESLRNVRFNEDENGGLSVWKFPEREEPGVRITDRYLVVVDIGGRSAKSDWSVIAVFDRKPMLRGEGPEVVAQWRGHIDFDLLAWNAARIATYYDRALLVIESNTIETRDSDRMVEGDQSLFLFNQLRDAYPNLYARGGSEADVREGVPAKYGFHTNVATKPMIITTLVKVIREGLYVERDELCLSEYLVYERRDNGSYGALQGHHDDILMTRAIGLHICFYEMARPRRVAYEPGQRRCTADRRFTRMEC